MERKKSIRLRALSIINKKTTISFLKDNLMYFTEIEHIYWHFPPRTFIYVAFMSLKGCIIQILHSPIHLSYFRNYRFTINTLYISVNPNSNNCSFFCMSFLLSLNFNSFFFTLSHESCIVNTNYSQRKTSMKSRF